MLIEIFCQKRIVSNVILAFLDHLRPKIFFVLQPWQAIQNATSFQNLWIRPFSPLNQNETAKSKHLIYQCNYNKQRKYLNRTDHAEIRFFTREKKQALIQKSQKFLYQCKKAINKVKTEIKIFFLSLDLKGFYKYHGFNNKGRNYSTDSFSQLRKVDQP